MAVAMPARPTVRPVQSPPCTTAVLRKARRSEVLGVTWGIESVAGGLGFEPRLTESESAVLPLNYPPRGPGGKRGPPAAPRENPQRGLFIRGGGDITPPPGARKSRAARAPRR